MPYVFYFSEELGGFRTLQYLYFFPPPRQEDFDVLPGTVAEYFLIKFVAFVNFGQEHYSSFVSLDCMPVLQDERRRSYHA